MLRGSLIRRAMIWWVRGGGAEMRVCPSGQPWFYSHVWKDLLFLHSVVWGLCLTQGTKRGGFTPGLSSVAFVYSSVGRPVRTPAPCCLRYCDCAGRGALRQSEPRAQAPPFPRGFRQSRSVPGPGKSPGAWGCSNLLKCSCAKDSVPQVQ